MRALIGRKGVAPEGEKEEGDLRTPAGRYALGTVFGRAESVEGLQMPYRQATRNDHWVDDPDSERYNQWVRLKSGEKPLWKSAERLRVSSYEHAVVVNYNMDPVTPGKGSAIFLHQTGDFKKGSSGCIAVSREDMLKILEWLQEDARPHIEIRARKA
jgi:L,D-peptidoglycan transpeptidase YkuD (ErfK/YbiS/YcfS/YnhG family)